MTIPKCTIAVVSAIKKHRCITSAKSLAFGVEVLNGIFMGKEKPENLKRGNLSLGSYARK